MFDSKKPSNNPNDKKKISKPKVIATKASIAREKAIIAQLKEAAKPKLNRKRKLDQSETLAETYQSTTAILNERPAWDLRGKMKDLNDMADLNAKRLDHILNFKRELEILKNDKESQEKTALQQAAALRTRIQESERDHAATIENLHAQQRIEFQRLEDDSINFSRRLTTIEIEVTDSQRQTDIVNEQVNQYNKQNKTLKDSIQRTSDKFNNIDVENKNLLKDIKKLDASISEIYREIEKEEKLNNTIDSAAEKIKESLVRSNSDRHRLDNKIKELENKRNSSKLK